MRILCVMLSVLVVMLTTACSTSQIIKTATMVLPYSVELNPPYYEAESALSAAYAANFSCKAEAAAEAEKISTGFSELAVLARNDLEAGITKWQNKDGPNVEAADRDLELTMAMFDWKADPDRLKRFAAECDSFVPVSLRMKEVNEKLGKWQSHMQEKLDSNLCPARYSAYEQLAIELDGYQTVMERLESENAYRVVNFGSVEREKEWEGVETFAGRANEVQQIEC